MSENPFAPRRAPTPDLATLLQTLREQSQQLPGPALRDNDLSLVRQISDQVAHLPQLTLARPDLRPLISALREHISTLESQVRFHDVGTVQRIGNGVATISGLPRAATDELVIFPTGVRGLILNLDHNHADVVLLGSDEGIQGGDLVNATGKRLRVPVGHNLLGRIINPLGEPLDEHGAIEAADYRYLEQTAPGIVEREPVTQPLQTGWKIIDALVPIGRGQRELIVGDRQTGKTTLAVDAILNQVDDTEVACVYVAIGQKKSSTLAVIESLQRVGALAYTTVVMSSPDDPPALRYLAPYTGCTIGEFLMQEGRDVLIVYDDLTKHADAYRELSLLLRRPPGREAYPGDIFYLHSRLLERAAKLNPAMGGGSLTALPIVETQRGTLSAYIPTNLISITDGQIVLETDLFNRGIKPAVNAGRSVSRVGGAAQSPAMRKLAGALRLELSQYEEVARFARIGAEVDAATQRQLRRGQQLQALLVQSAHQPRSLALQVAALLALTEGYFEALQPEQVAQFEQALVQRLVAEHPALVAQLNRTGELLPEIREGFVHTLERLSAQWAERGTR